MRGKNRPRSLFGFLIFSSLFLQAWYFGEWSAIRTIVGSVAAFALMITICQAGKRLNSGNCRYKVIRYVIGYTTLSGAKGRSRQLFDLFVEYFALSGLPNLPLVEDSTRFFLTLFPLTIGLMGLTNRWINERCQE